MKNFKQLLFTASLVCLTAQANAISLPEPPSVPTNLVNESYVKPLDSFSCPVKEWEYTGTYKKVGTCDRGGWSPNDEYYFQYKQHHYIKAYTHSSYAISCYHKASAYIDKLALPVQPLSNDFAVHSKLINKIKYNTLVGGSGNPNYNGIDAKVALQGLENGATSVSTQAGSKSVARAGIADMDNQDTGGGSSAMQGLLWSFRLISPNWIGKWNQKSYYETNTFTRTELPSGDASKNIVIISDGLDTDGPSNADSSTTGDYQDSFNSARNYIDFRILKNASTKAPRTGKLPYEVCDAHMNLSSVTFNDYVNVCNQIAAKGIKVHVILYGYSENNSLKECARITGGEYLKNVSPAELTQKMKGLVNTIRGNPSVRLID